MLYIPKLIFLKIVCMYALFQAVGIKEEFLCIEVLNEKFVLFGTP